MGGDGSYERTGGSVKPSVAFPPSVASLPPLKIESFNNAPINPCEPSTDTFVLQR